VVVARRRLPTTIRRNRSMPGTSCNDLLRVGSRVSVSTLPIAVTDALRSPPSPRRTCSPNVSPGWSTSMIDTSPPIVVSRTATCPMSSRWSAPAGSPSWKIVSPRP
jgi:hypothetical protein